MAWFGGDPANQEAYGGSKQPLQDAVDQAKGTKAQEIANKVRADGNGHGKR